MLNKNIYNKVTEIENYLYVIEKYTGYSKKDILKYLKNAPINIKELSIFCSVYGKFPEKEEYIKIIKHRELQFVTISLKEFLYISKQNEFLI